MTRAQTSLKTRHTSHFSKANFFGLMTFRINSDVRIEKAVHMHGFFFLRNKSIMKKMFFIIPSQPADRFINTSEKWFMKIQKNNG